MEFERRGGGERERERERERETVTTLVSEGVFGILIRLGCVLFSQC